MPASLSNCQRLKRQTRALARHGEPSRCRGGGHIRWLQHLLYYRLEFGTGSLQSCLGKDTGAGTEPGGGERGGKSGAID